MKKIALSLAQIRIIYVVTTIFLVVLSLYTYNLIKRFSESVEVVNHTTKVSLELEKLMGDMKEAESWHRGYLLTHDSTFLHKFYQGLEDYYVRVERIRRMTLDNIPQQKNLFQLKPLSSRRTRLMFRILEIDRHRKPTSSEMQEGIMVMDSLRARIDVMRQIENTLLKVRTKSYTEISYLTLLFIIVLFLGSILVLSVSYFRLNKAMVESNQLQKALKEIVTEAGEGICMLRGPNHYVELANKNYLAMISNRDVFNRQAREAIPEWEQQGVITLLDEVFQTGTTVYKNEVEIHMPRLNGTYNERLFNFTYRPTHSKREKVDGVVIHATDVTEQAIIRKRLEASEARYKDLIKKLPVAVYTCDKNGYVQQYNEAAVALWGREPELGKEMWCGSWKVFKIDGSEVLASEYPMIVALKEGRIVKMPLIIERPDGTRSWVIPFPQLEYDAEGNIAGAVNTIIDITEQKLTREKIEANEEQLRIAIESSNLGAYDYNVQDDRLSMSSKTFEIYGFSPSDVVTLDLLNECLHSDYKEEFKVLENVIGGPDTDKFEIEYKILRKNDGQVRWIRSNGKTVRNSSGALIRVTGVIQDITERKEAEEKSAKLAAIVESSEDAIISKLLDGTITSWNLGAQQIFGYTPEEIIGKNICTLFPPDRMNEEAQIIARMMKGEKISPFETQRVTKDNKTIDVSLTISPLMGRNGKIIGASKIARDITQHKRAERAMAENEQKLQMVIEASALGTWELDLETGTPSYDKRYLEILGFNPVEKPSHVEILKRLHPDDHGIREKAFERAMKTGTLYYVARLVWPDKSIHWMEGRGKVFYNEARKPVRMVGTLRDITEEKKYQERIEESEKRFRNLTQTLPQLIWVTDAKGVHEFRSSRWEEYSGSKAVDLHEWEAIVHPDDLDGINKAWMHSLSTGEVYKYDVRLRSKTGEYHWYKVIGEPVYGINNEIVNWVGAFTEIHDEKLFSLELEKQVRDRTTELEESNATLKRANNELELFAHISSHDLQEPLRKVQMSVSRIAERDFNGLSEKGKEHFRRVQEATATMQTLIDDLQMYSRTNRQSSSFEMTDLTDLLYEALEGLKERIEEKKAVIEVSQLCKANIIPFEFRQLMYNLVGNALKFSKPGEIPRIVIKSKSAYGKEFGYNMLSPDKKYCYVSVTDNGIGFDEKYSEKIFEVFQRLHSKEEYKGTGIGLAIAKKIVENHNGFIVAKGQLGKGATFEIFIPSNN